MEYEITPVRHRLSIMDQTEIEAAGKANPKYFPYINFNTLIVYSPHHTGRDTDMNIDGTNPVDDRPVIELQEVNENGN